MKNDLRPPMSPAGRRLRAYFAPVDRASGTPAVFDPARAFDLDAPPAPWISLGWIDHLKRAPAACFFQSSIVNQQSSILNFIPALELNYD